MAGVGPPPGPMSRVRCPNNSLPAVEQPVVNLMPFLTVDPAGNWPWASMGGGLVISMAPTTGRGQTGGGGLAGPGGAPPAGGG